jgi:hypothetical protein
MRVTGHYRLRPGASLPGELATRLVVPLDEFTAVLFGADNGAMQLAIALLRRPSRHRRRTAGDPPATACDVVQGRVSFREMRVAAAIDPDALRAFWRIQGLISSPGHVYADPRVTVATRAALRDPRGAPPIAQPSRAQLLAALAT